MTKIQPSGEIAKPERIPRQRFHKCSRIIIRVHSCVFVASLSIPSQSPFPCLSKVTSPDFRDEPNKSPASRGFYWSHAIHLFNSFQCIRPNHTAYKFVKMREGEGFAQKNTIFRKSLRNNRFFLIIPRNKNDRQVCFYFAHGRH